MVLASLLDDTKQWCNNNPKELVLIFHLELVHKAGYNGLLSQVYLKVDGNAYTTNYTADDVDGEAELTDILLLVGDKQDSCSAKQ